MHILLFLIIIFLILPLILVRVAFWYFKYKVKRGINRAFGRGGDNSKSSWSGDPRRRARRQTTRKIFGKDVGEYVEFEEISVFNNTAQTSASQSNPFQSNTSRTSSRPDFKPESQIEDVEWEDIK